MIRIAVLSDIHAHSTASLNDGESPPSYAEISAPESPGANPFAALEELIALEGLEADVLVSGGDMGDKATPGAIQYAWDRIRRLSPLLNAKILIAATGNHDMDSRAINSFDAKAVLQGLDSYPFEDHLLNNEYWANNVVVQEELGFRTVLLNSSAYHGYANEWQHGRVSERTREYLKKRLRETKDYGLNILVTHHQVCKQGSIDLEDKSEMQDGTALLEDLGSGEFGSWLIIHGHRHWPSIGHASGGRGAPLVFSAGSFSAVLWKELQGHARNQFYILELEETEPGEPIQGRFKAWDWVSDQGFRRAQPASGLAYSGGFGSSLNGAQLARMVSAHYKQVGQGYLNWAEVESGVPEVPFMIPSDFDTFTRILKETYELSILHDSDGLPVQLGGL